MLWQAPNGQIIDDGVDTPPRCMLCGGWAAEKYRESHLCDHHAEKYPHFIKDSEKEGQRND